MPILWRYALHSYSRVFSLSVFTFITVLIIARFKEMARFTALTGDFLKTGLFIVYQIPSILPIAIPLSALLASFLLLQRMSRELELTAMRASGLSLKVILTPLLILSSFLSLLNFSICADIAPYCRREGKTLIYHETSPNPLLLLQRQKLVKIKHAYLNMKVKNEETTKDLTLIVPYNDRLALFSARKLRMQGEELLGSDLAAISYPLLIENQSLMSTSAPLLSEALKKNRPHLDINSFDFKMLRMNKKTKPARIEMLRRISLSLAVFSLTLLGAAFGMEMGRAASKKNLMYALLLTLTVLMSYLFGKGLKNHLSLAAITFLLPHPLIWFCSLFRLYRMARGRA
jgi:lipopolysaccharide export system permease protein